MLFTADDDFFAAFWLGICVEVDVDVITTPPPTPSRPVPPRPALMFLSLSTILSLMQVTVIRNQCGPKAGFGTA